MVVGFGSAGVFRMTLFGRTLSRHASALALFAAVAIPTAAPLQAQAADIATGEKAFMRVCANCHAADALGADGPPLLPLKHGAEEMLQIARGGKDMMPPLPAATITDDEINSVALYLASIKADK